MRGTGDKVWKMLSGISCVSCLPTKQFIIRRVRHSHKEWECKVEVFKWKAQENAMEAQRKHEYSYSHTSWKRHNSSWLKDQISSILRLTHFIVMTRVLCTFSVRLWNLCLFYIVRYHIFKTDTVCDTQQAPIEHLFNGWVNFLHVRSSSWIWSPEDDLLCFLFMWLSTSPKVVQ